MVKIKGDMNQQDFKIIDHHFVKSENCPLTWICESHQRDTTSSEKIFELTNLKGYAYTYP